MKQLLVMAAVVLFGGCMTFPMEDSAPYTSGPEKRDVPHWYAESTAAIFPTGGPRSDDDCVLGRMIVASSSGAAGDPGTPAILLRDFHNTAADLTPLDHAKIQGIDGKDDLTITADHILVRRATGELILIWGGVTWDDEFPGATPAWSSVDVRGDGRKGLRAVLYSFRSFDCGSTWTAMKEIDAGDSNLLNGDLGWPRDNWHGGFDRLEAYADPFTGNVYLTAWSVSGGRPSIPTVPQRAHMVLFLLRPGQTQWELLVSFEASGSNTGTFDSVDVPMVMATTNQGRLYLAQCDGGTVKLYWMNKDHIAIGNKSLSGKMDLVKAGEGNDCATLPAGSIAGGFDSYYDSWPLLSRWYAGPSSGGVRLAYPMVENGRQVARILMINDLTGPKIDVTELTTLDAGDRSIVQAAFIENDPTEMQTLTDVTAMYWLAGNREAMQAEYTIWRGPFFEKTKALSVSNGKTVSWVPKLYGNWGGDYFRGASYAAGGKVFYFMQWPQSDATAAEPNSNLHYRVVAAKP